MTFTIPNTADADHPRQSELDSVDIDIIVAALNGRGVLSGCEVSAQGSPDMTVAVASGVVMIDGARVTVTGANGTISTADSSNPRFDIVSINSSGTIVVTAGTPAIRPVFPAVPANSAALAAVHVPASDTAIQSSQIVDKHMVMANVAAAGAQDDILVRLGTDGNISMLNRSTVLNANTALLNALIGTPVTPALTANSLILANIIADGGILLAVNKDGHSQMVLWSDPSVDITAINAPAGGSVSLRLGNSEEMNVAENALTGNVVGTGASQVASGDHSAPASSATLSGHVELATLAEARAGTDTTRAVTPAGLQGHQGVLGAWANHDAAGNIAASHNATSTGKDSTGIYTLTYDVDFVGGNDYAGWASAAVASLYATPVTRAAGSQQYQVRSDSNTLTDGDASSFAVGVLS